MINRFCKRAAALVLALIGMASACGCAKRAEADATFVMLTAPTVEPIVTPVPTPEATPPPKKTPNAEKSCILVCLRVKFALLCVLTVRYCVAVIKLVRSR